MKFKSIHDAFEDYRVNVLPSDIPASHLVLAKRAFYGGFGLAMDAMMDNSFSAEDMERWTRELVDFITTTRHDDDRELGPLILGAPTPKRK